MRFTVEILQDQEVNSTGTVTKCCVIGSHGEDTQDPFNPFPHQSH